MFVSILICSLVLVSGCADVFFGSQKFGDFGSSVNEQKAVNCFIEKYGDPRINTGPARFLEPVITTGLSDNTPVDTVLKLNKETPKVYFWVFYDNFAKGDDLELKWTYLVSGKDVMTLHQKAGGDFGRAYAEFLKPDTGLPVGQHKITISGNGTSASTTIEVIDGATVTGTLPCSQDGAPNKQEEGKTKVMPYNGPPPREILSYIADKTKTQGVVKIPTPAVGTQYEIYVHTGNVDGAGTDANVQIKIFGDGGETEWFVLDTSKDNFERNTVDDFYKISPDIGELKEINLNFYQEVQSWSGERNTWSPAWYLEAIFVVNSRTNQAWVFPYDQWVPLDYNTLLPGYRWTEYPYNTDSATPPPIPQGSMTPAPTSQAPIAPPPPSPLAVPLHTTPIINYPVETQLKVITPTPTTLFPSTPPTTTPTTIPTTPIAVHLNTTPTTAIPHYSGYSY